MKNGERFHERCGVQLSFATSSASVSSSAGRVASCSCCGFDRMERRGDVGQFQPKLGPDTGKKGVDNGEANRSIEDCLG